MINCLIKEYVQVLLQFPLQPQAAGFLVFGEIGLEGELLATPPTAEGLHVAVGLHVSPEVALVSKALGALSAAEGFLPGVSPDVSLEEPGPGERFPTERTLAARSVSPHVHAEGGRAAVLLAANSTHSAALGCLTAGRAGAQLGVEGQVQRLTLLRPGGGGGGRGGGGPVGGGGAAAPAVQPGRD